jgi:hypothetical protein
METAMTTEIKSTQTARIRALNDALRKDFSQGHAVMTTGIAATPAAVASIRTFSFSMTYSMIERTTLTFTRAADPLSGSLRFTAAMKAQLVTDAATVPSPTRRTGKEDPA